MYSLYMMAADGENNSDGMTPVHIAAHAPDCAGVTEDIRGLGTRTASVTTGPGIGTRPIRPARISTTTGEFMAAGGVGVAFGTGAANQTYITTDGGQFKTAAAAYFASPQALP